MLDKKAKDLFDVSEELDIFWGVVVVAQLVERSLLTPEVRSSNPVIGKLLSDIYLITVNWIEKTKMKKKRPGMAHFLKKKSLLDKYFQAFDYF